MPKLGSPRLGARSVGRNKATHVVNIQVSEELYQRIFAVATSEKRSLTAQIEYLLEKVLEKKED